MGTRGYLLLGMALGAAAAYVINYFFGPTDAATYDEHYRSRLDFALDEGKRAALERENELRLQLQNLRPPAPPAPNPGTNGA